MKFWPLVLSREAPEFLSTSIAHHAVQSMLGSDLSFFEAEIVDGEEVNEKNEEKLDVEENTKGTCKELCNLQQICCYQLLTSCSNKHARSICNP